MILILTFLFTMMVQLFPLTSFLPVLLNGQDTVQAAAKLEPDRVSQDSGVR